MHKNNWLPILIFLLSFFFLTLLQSFLWRTMWTIADNVSLWADLSTLIIFCFIILIPYWIMKILIKLANKYSDSLYIKLFFKNWLATFILLIVCIFIDANYTIFNSIPFVVILGTSFFTGNFVALLWARMEYKHFNKNYFFKKSLMVKFTVEITRIIFLNIFIWFVTMLFFLSISLYYNVFK